MGMNVNVSGTWRNPRVYAFAAGAYQTVTGGWRHDGVTWRQFYLSSASALAGIALVGGTTYQLSTVLSYRGFNFQFFWDSSNGNLEIRGTGNVPSGIFAYLHFAKSPENIFIYLRQFTFVPFDGSVTKWTLAGSDITYTSGSAVATLWG